MKTIKQSQHNCGRVTRRSAHTVCKIQQESCAMTKMTTRCALYGCPENFRESLTKPTATFPKCFNGFLLLIDPMNLRTKFELRIFTRS